MQISKLFVCGFLILSMCGQKKTDVISEKFLKSYSLDEMKSVFLPTELKEISGLDWVSDDQLWAVEDESAKIFQIDPKTGEILKKVNFGKKADFEDLVVIDGIAWILQSNGDIYRVTDPFGETGETTQFQFPSIGKRDMEAMVAAENGNELWLFCKECKIDKGTEEASAFRFDLETLLFDSLPFKKLERKNLKTLHQSQDSKSLKIQPSAAAIHPIEKKIYMISSSGNWLSILDTDLNPLEVHWLDPKLFKQPEGIAFDPSGNLYISNEAAGGRASLLIFPFKP